MDLLGGLAALQEAVLLGPGERVFHLSGMAVNRVCESYRGEHKSDRRDALYLFKAAPPSTFSKRIRYYIHEVLEEYLERGDLVEVILRYRTLEKEE